MRFFSHICNNCHHQTPVACLHQECDRSVALQIETADADKLCAECSELLAERDAVAAYFAANQINENRGIK